MKKLKLSRNRKKSRPSRKREVAEVYNGPDL